MKVINNIESYKAYDTALLYCKSGDLYCNEKLVAPNVNSVLYALVNNLVVYTKESRVYVGEQELPYASFLRKKDVSEYFIFLKNYELQSNGIVSDIYINNLSCSEEVYLGRFARTYLSLIESNCFVFGSDTHIYCYTPNASGGLWQYDLSQLGTYHDSAHGECSYDLVCLIGIYENTLWVAARLSNILCFDIHTGTLLKRLKGFELVSDRRMAGGGRSSYMLDRENKRIVWLSFNALLHIELPTGEIRVIRDYINAPKPEQWRFRDSMLQEDKVFFTGVLGNETLWPKRVGVMDANTGDIFWNLYLGEFLRAGDVPQVVGNRLYVNSTNGNLYIFEKEEYEVKDV